LAVSAAGALSAGAGALTPNDTTGGALAGMPKLGAGAAGATTVGVELAAAPNDTEAAGAPLGAPKPNDGAVPAPPNIGAAAVAPKLGAGAAAAAAAGAGGGGLAGAGRLACCTGGLGELASFSDSSPPAPASAENRLLAASVGGVDRGALLGCSGVRGLASLGLLSAALAGGGGGGVAVGWTTGGALPVPAGSSAFAAGASAGAGAGVGRPNDSCIGRDSQTPALESHTP
jgi:hypothetical protein